MANICSAAARTKFYDPKMFRKKLRVNSSLEIRVQGNSKRIASCKAIRALLAFILPSSTEKVCGSLDFQNRNGGRASIVMITHPASEKDIDNSLSKVGELGELLKPIQRIRVLS